MTGFSPLRLGPRVLGHLAVLLEASFWKVEIILRPHLEGGDHTSVQSVAGSPQPGALAGGVP